MHTYINNDCTVEDDEFNGYQSFIYHFEQFYIAIAYTNLLN